MTARCGLATAADASAGDATVAASFLGSIERLVCAIEGRTGWVAGNECSDAARYGDRHRSTAEVKSKRGDGLAPLIDDASGILQTRTGQNHHELFAAVTCNEVRAANSAGEAFGHGLQHAIAG